MSHNFKTVFKTHQPYSVVDLWLPSWRRPSVQNWARTTLKDGCSMDWPWRSPCLSRSLPWCWPTSCRSEMTMTVRSHGIFFWSESRLSLRIWGGFREEACSVLVVFFLHQKFQMFKIIAKMQSFCQVFKVIAKFTKSLPNSQSHCQSFKVTAKLQSLCQNFTKSLPQSQESSQ